VGFIYSHTKQSWAVAAVADTTNYTDGKYHAVIGDSTTRMLRITEIFIGGEASAAALALMVLARDSTIGATLSNGSGTAIAAVSSGAPTVRATTFDTATTKPQRAATLHLLQLSMQAFGGVVRWVAAPGSELYQVGNAVNVGETSLSAFTGSGTPAISSHLQFEEL